MGVGDITVTLNRTHTFIDQYGHSPTVETPESVFAAITFSKHFTYCIEMSQITYNGVNEAVKGNVRNNNNQHSPLGGPPGGIQESESRVH